MFNSFFRFTIAQITNTKFKKVIIFAEKLRKAIDFFVQIGYNINKKSVTITDLISKITIC